jgi:Flp pilus assembly pilin Flp
MFREEGRMLQRIVMGFVQRTRTFAKDDKGIGVVELILILVVLIGLVVIFRDQLTSLVNSIFERIVNDSQAV